jgi:glycosyltransferase involved in cell wall biosynthesis
MLVADGVPAERTVTVHEGIDVDHVVRGAAGQRHEAFWLPHQAPVVGNVAALVPHKGQRYLIDAAHLVVQEVPDARFIILGEGELREHLEKQVHDTISRSTCCCPASAPTSSAASRGSTCSS